MPQPATLAPAAQTPLAAGVRPLKPNVSGCPACGGLATRCRYTQAFWLRPVAWLLNTPLHGH
ncbi:hypothetical protein EAG14_21265 [Acidovorax sp. 1608163]|nr:hypothetical protein EAG14_21265 [Acidovorax sp. 1608163]